MNLSERLDAADFAARSVAKRYWMRNDLPDLMQEARIAVWQSAETDRKALRFVGLDRASHLVHDQSQAWTGKPRLSNSGHERATGRQTRDAIRAYLKVNPEASGRQISRALGISAPAVQKHLQRLNAFSGPQITETPVPLGDFQGYDGEVPDFSSAVETGVFVRQLLQVLDSAERTAVYLKFWHDATNPQIAAALGSTNRNWPTRLISRALEKMREAAQ